MTPQENKLSEGNKLIGDFMGRSFKDPLNYMYDKSWDWIMPVWDRFRYLVWETKEFEKFKNDFMTGVFNGSIITCQRVMVEAITWYNNTKK